MSASSAMKEPKLACEIEICLVVRRGGEKDNLAFVAIDVIPDDAVALAFAIAEVVALVDQNEPITLYLFRKFLDRSADREDSTPQSILLPVLLPHRDEVLGGQDQRFQTVIVLEDAGHGRRHQGLSQTDDIADEHAAPLVEMVGGDLDRCDLELEQLVNKVAREAETRSSPLGLLARGGTQS